MKEFTYSVFDIKKETFLENKDSDEPLKRKSGVVQASLTKKRTANGMG